MESSKVSTGDLNKYFMPKYFDYIFKNYLPNCTLWLGLLLGDLQRYKNTCNAESSHQYNPFIRNSQVDNKTNAQVENFFKIKKSSSFKGNQQLRLDTFIGENWVDNKALQREFVDGLLKGIGKMNKNPQKVEQFCSLDISAAEDISDNSDKDSQINSYRPEEKWHKQTPKTGLKKGKYLSPSAKKLNFNPELSKEPQKKSKEHNYDSSGTFTRYERNMWKTVAAQNDMKDFSSIRKEIKRMWNTLGVVEGETYNNEYGGKLECQPVMTEQTLPKPGQADEHSDKIRKKEQKTIAMKNQTCCICRQARCANTIECSLARKISISIVLISVKILLGVEKQTIFAQIASILTTFLS